jgi:predicted nucleic acid-binding Zn ribbon protein
MSDEPVKDCEVCGEPVRRLLFPVAVHFKGNGFYTTDYAKKNTIGTPGTNTANGGNSDSSSSSSTESKGSSEGSTTPAAKASEPAAATTKKD